MGFLRIGFLFRQLAAGVLFLIVWMQLYPVAVNAEAASEAHQAAKNGDFGDLRSIARSVLSSSVEELSEYAPGEIGLHGTEDQRGFNDAHEIGTSNNDIVNGSQAFEAQLINSEDTTEVKVYRKLHAIYTDPSYHTRDSDNKAVGDAVIFNTDEGGSLLAEYQRLNADMESGTQCRIQVVQPEVVEMSEVATEFTCGYSNSAVYWESECRVTRELTLPGVDAEGLSHEVGSARTQHTLAKTFPADFALYQKTYFTIQSVEDVSATISLGQRFDASHYLMVNGNRVSTSGGSITEFLVEGQNEVFASCSLGPILNTNQAVAPIGEIAPQLDLRPKRCDSNGDGVLDGVTLSGDLTWSEPVRFYDSDRFLNAREAANDCPSGYYHVGYDDNYDRAGFRMVDMAKRCFKPYQEEVCQPLSEEIRSITQDPEEMEFLVHYDRLRHVMPNPAPLSPNTSEEYRYPSYEQSSKSEDIPFFDSRPDYDNANNQQIPPGVMVFSPKWRLKNNTMYLSADDGRIYKWEMADIIGGDGGGYEKPAGWYQYTDNRNCAMPIGSSGTYTQGPCRATSLAGGLYWMNRWERDGNHLSDYPSGALSTYAYAMGCGFESISINFEFQHENAREVVSEQPANCVSGINQWVDDLAGNRYYNLNGTAFPYTSDATPPSTNTWLCDDHDPARFHGNLLPKEATMDLVGNSLVEMFPDDLQSMEVCYSAYSPKYGVDISGLPRCNDGTFNCWLEGHAALSFGGQYRPDSRTLLEKFIDALNPIQRSWATGDFDGAISVGEAAFVNQCTTYEENDRCRLISSVCDITDPLSGECQWYTRTYSCVEQERVVIQEAVTQTVCTSPFPCSQGGDEYCEYTTEETDSFEETAIALTVAQMSSNDSNCLTTEPSSCVVFDGEDNQCRSYVAAGLGEALPTGNCCSQPSGAPGPVAYVKTVYALAQTEFVQTTVTDIASWVTSTGAWQDYVIEPAQYVSDLAVDGYNAVVDYFSNQAASVAYQEGTNVVAEVAAESASAGLGTTITAGANFLMADISALLGEVLGDWIVEDVIRDEVTGEIIAYASDAAFEEAASQGVASTAIDSGVSSAIGSAFATFMMIYMIYKITMLVNQLLIACGSDEFEAAYKLGTGSCFQIANSDPCTDRNIFGCQEKTKSLCCYSSPLARIIQQQAMLTGQSPYDRNSAYENGCPGFTFEDFGRLDIGRMDLSEWVGLMVSAGKLPDGTSESESAYTSIDVVTRSLSKNDADFDAETSEVPNAAERATDLVSASGDSMEEYRMIDREALLAGDQYESDSEFCGYIHDVVSGTSVSGFRKFAVFADGEKKYLSRCIETEQSETFSHEIRTDGCDLVDLNGELIQPETRWFSGLYEEEVVVVECSTQTY
jgi:hypothetical protein